MIIAGFQIAATNHTVTMAYREFLHFYSAFVAGSFIFPRILLHSSHAAYVYGTRSDVIAKYLKSH